MTTGTPENTPRPAQRLDQPTGVFSALFSAWTNEPMVARILEQHALCDCGKQILSFHFNLFNSVYSLA